MFLIAIYVDDIILATKSEDRLKQVKDTLAAQFEVKDIGPLHYFLGVNIMQDQNHESIWIGQPTYSQSLLRRFNMEMAKPVKTPVSSSSRLMKATEMDGCVDKSLYQSAIGSLLYLATRTRPDIAFAVNQVAKFSNSPTKEHWTAVK